MPGRGVPAIPPSRPGASPDQATFTEEEVRAFIAKRGGGFGKMRVAGPYEIESVIVLRSIEAPARLGVVAGGVNDQLLAAATLRGTFTVTGPPGPGAQVYTYSKMVLVFDARTGNLLDQIALP